MLELKDVVVNYGSIAALHGISISIEPGTIVTLVGANGAGKTTTLADDFRGWCVPNRELLPLGEKTLRSWRLIRLLAGAWPSRRKAHGLSRI
jgi:ABC-type uncharacterized transport system ATPase subunit